MALFLRVAELEVGQAGKIGIFIKDLRFSFNVEKTLSETLNNSTLKIYNLSPSSRRLVETPNNLVILRAGYEHDIGAITIFTGSVRRALTSKDGADWVTELELDDGLIAYRDSKVSISFPPGAKGADVLSSIATKLNIPVKSLPSDIAKKIYPTGFSFVGKSREAVSKVCEYLGLEWSIQDQEVQILKKGGSVKNQVIVLSPGSGLLGSPALEAKTMGDKEAAKQGITTDSKGVITRNKASEDGDIKPRLEVQGYKVKSLLQPTLIPGHMVKLQAEGIDDFLKIEKVSHIGDTYGSEWYTELSLRY